MSRPCPVCNSTANTHLFTQEFADFTLLKSYDIVTCNNCGMAYADNIPPQADFDQYYRTMSKYQKPTTFDLKYFAQRAEELRHILPHHSTVRDHRILDIGCASGGLTKALKKVGFPYVEGVDIGATPKHDQYDLVTLTAVLEHIADVQEFLKGVIKYVKREGYLLVEVPNADMFQACRSAPFQFFSTEHINFFNSYSLEHLMARLGFQDLIVEDRDRPQATSIVEPFVVGLFGRYEASFKVARPNVESYIAKSQKEEQRIHKILQDLATDRIPIVVWGTGTHTLRLLKTSPLEGCRILAFIDTNPNYQGKKLEHIGIYGPDWLLPDDYPGPQIFQVLISSHVYQEEIKAQVEAMGHIPICLYEH